MKDRVAMLVSVLTRMGAGLLVFVLMARGLGPEAYGLVVTVIAYATLVSLVTDFGFASKTLRDIAADRPRGGDILNASLNVKIILTSVAILVGGAIVLVAPAPPGTQVAILMLGAAILVGAIGDLAFTAYRAVGRYAEEAWLTLWTSGVHLAVIGWIALAHGDITLLACAYLVSRTIYTALALHGAMRLFPGTRFHAQFPRDVLQTAGGAWSWAVDSGLGYLNVQVDSLVVGAMFGLTAAGIYQSGNRLLQAGFAVTVALAGVHTPRMAALNASPISLSPGEGRMYLEFLAVAVLGALGLLLVGPLVIIYAVGEEYAGAVQLLPAFAAFFATRCVAAALGVALVAVNASIYRVVGQVAGFAVASVGFLLFAPRFGIESVPVFMVLGAATTMVVYGLGRFGFLPKRSSGGVGTKG